MIQSITDLRRYVALGNAIYAAIYLTPTPEQWERIHNALMLMPEPSDADLHSIEEEGWK